MYFVCDASNQGIGKGEFPIAYFSRKFYPYEENYTTSEFDCLAIVDAIQKWHHYLHGTNFTVVSDHSALQRLHNIKNPSGRLFRWSLRLSQYDYNIKHIKGEHQLEADALSRQSISTVNLLSAAELLENQSQISYNSKYIDSQGIKNISKGGIQKIVVPHPLRIKLLEKAHQDFSHPGIKKTLSILSPVYYWPKITKNIRIISSIVKLVKSLKNPIKRNMVFLVLCH